MALERQYLEWEFLAVRRRRQTYLVRSGRAASETDETSTRMTGQCLARLSSAPEYHVHHSGRQAYIDKNIG